MKKKTKVFIKEKGTSIVKIEEDRRISRLTYMTSYNFF